jgi:hypothetical protein
MNLTEQKEFPINSVNTEYSIMAKSEEQYQILTLTFHSFPLPSHIKIHINMSDKEGKSSTILENKKRLRAFRKLMCN